MSVTTDTPKTYARHCVRCGVPYQTEQPNLQKCPVCASITPEQDALAFLRGEGYMCFHNHIGVDTEWVERHIVRPILSDDVPAVVFNDVNGGDYMGLSQAVFRSCVTDILKARKKGQAKQAISRERVERAARMCSGVAKNAAQMLGCTKNSFVRLCREHGVEYLKPASGRKRRVDSLTKPLST